MPNNPVSNEIAISLKNISKYYKLYNSPKDRLKEALSFSGKIYHKKFYATKNLSLEVKKGEILGIVGKNGSGKSTLLKLITGVLTPDEGSVTVNGKISALLELGSGFNPEFTGMQNIFFYGTILGFSKEEIEAKLDDIIAFAEIGDFIYQPLKTYSSGMKSRLGFAVAVHIDPEILILDEVLAVGDVLFRRKCYAKMEEFFKGGKTIIYVSHDANSVNELCTRAIFLNKGSILLDGEAKIVTQYYQKYLFAKNDEIQKVEREIINLSKSKDMILENKIIDNKSSEKSSRPKYLDSETYDKNMKSNPVVFNEHIAYFHDINIKNSSGQVVNHLLMGNRYKVEFSITFKKKLHDVSAGMQIQTLKGVLISGANMKAYLNESIEVINSNETYNFNIEFDCLLLPSTYFIKLFATADNENIVTMEDAIIFKVKDGIAKQGGYVTLNQSINYIKR